ncbi:MAG: Rid family detoxifying hydrolase [Phascolarctobacterium faecium]
MKKIIKTENAPAAIGPYSQAVMANGMLYMSGQIALVPETGEVVDEGIEAQTIRVLKNMEGVLSEAGLTFDDVVKTTVFLTDMEDFGVVNSIYGEKFAETLLRVPAQVGDAESVKVEIEAIAVCK